VERALLEGRYGLVVLREDLEVSERWYRAMHLGDRVVNAILSRYRRIGVADGYVLYAPDL
jgi:hypothetical protein